MALHELPPDIALKQVEDEADTFSFTMSTVSSRSTILGLGSSSGKAIQAFGEALLSGIDKLYDRGRLQSIKRQLRNERKSQAPFPKAFYKALFGYQRIGVYPEHVRQNAWSLVFLLMEKGDSHLSMMVDAMLVDETEGRFFLLQLAIYKYSNWTANNIWWPSPQLDRSVRKILLLILQNRPSLVHEEFDITQFLYLCCEGYATQETQHITMEHLWWINPTPSTVEFGVQAVSSSLLLCMIWYIFTAPRLRLMSYLLQYKMLLKWYSIRYLFDAYYHGLRRTLSDIDAALAFLTTMPSTPNLTEGDIDRFLAHCSSQFNSMGRGHQSRLVFTPENAIHTVLDQFVKFEMPDTDNFPSFIRSEAYKYLIMAFEGNRTNYVHGTNVGYASVLSVPHPQIRFTHPEVCTWAKDAINVFAIHPSKVRASKDILAISRMFIGIGRVVPRKNGVISQELPYWYILVKLLSAEYMATKYVPSIPPYPPNSFAEDITRIILYHSPLSSNMWIDIGEILDRRAIGVCIAYILSLRDGMSEIPEMLQELNRMEGYYPSTFQTDDDSNVIFSFVRMVSRHAHRPLMKTSIGEAFVSLGGRMILERLAVGNYDFLRIRGSESGLEESLKEEHTERRRDICAALSAVFDQDLVGRTTTVQGFGLMRAVDIL